MLGDSSCSETLEYSIAIVRLWALVVSYMIDVPLQGKEGGLKETLFTHDEKDNFDCVNSEENRSK